MYTKNIAPAHAQTMLSSQYIEKLEIIGSGSFGRVFKWYKFLISFFSAI